MVTTFLNQSNEKLLVQHSESAWLFDYIKKHGDVSLLQRITSPVEHTIRTTKGTKDTRSFNDVKLGSWVITKIAENGAVPECVLDTLAEGEEVIDRYVFRKLISVGELAWFNEKQRLDAFHCYVEMSLTPLIKRAKRLSLPVVRVYEGFTAKSFSSNKTALLMFVKSVTAKYEEGDDGWMSYGDCLVVTIAHGVVGYDTQEAVALDVIDVEAFLANPELLLGDYDDLPSTPLVEYMPVDEY